jgi:eukaryotic-like serine/threonine-protein kinase
MTIATDTQLGSYKILSPLGAGGMGEVYLAEDTRLRRKVALKVLPDSLAQHKERLRRFEQEAFAASALNHPNILTIYEFGVEGETHFLAAEFIDGETLRTRLERAPLALAEALDIAVQTAQALAAAHAAHIIHRDIKPENVMLRKDGIVKVLDFGLAKLVESAPLDAEAETRKLGLTQAGTVMGTVAYMSPEQTRGLAVDVRTDLFSLGVMLYEMLTRRQPFTGETFNHVIVAILEQEPPPLASEVPTELTRIVSQALAKQVEERYGSAQAMLAELKKLQMRLLMESEYKHNSADNEPVEAQTLMLQQTTAGAPEMLATAAGSAQPTTPNKPKAQKWWLAAGLSLLVLVGGYFGYRSFTPNGKQIESIAVLPFVNESGNTDVEYLSDGMTETLISSLSQLPKLNVKARSSVFRYKGKEFDLPKVAQELKVQAILTGRVVQRGEQLTLSLELVDARTENVLWSERYNRRQTDLVTLQSELARDVSSKLKAKLSGADEQKLAKTYTENSAAYQLYLKGRFYLNKRERRDFQQAIEYFKQAIALDPKYALAYAGLADSYALPSTFGFTPPSEGMTKAREFALKALSFDGSLAEPHTTLGLTLLSYDYDFAGAERAYKRAIELNPNYATAHHWYGEMLTSVGRFDEAAAEYRRGLEIEPLSLPLNWDYGRCLYLSRKFDDAITQHKKTLELDAGFSRAHRTLSEVYRVKGDHAKAIEEQVKNFELSGEPQNAALIREAFAKGGWQGYLRLVTAENSSLKDRHFVIAKAYVELGEKDKAFAELNKAYENRESPLQWLKVEPQLDPLRSDPRFQALLKRVGFPP